MRRLPTVRGITETTRASARYPERQSSIHKRNATPEDLVLAKRHIGKQIPLRPVHADPHPPRYRCVGVRLDELHRLIFDLVREDLLDEEEGHYHA
jgi:hypothetical protein